MPKLEFKTARGEIWYANIFVEKVPQTWQVLTAFLPKTLKAHNARWSGRETHTPLHLPTKPPRENQSCQMSKGDVIYGFEWPPERENTGFEAIGWFYAAEVVRDWRGYMPVNVIGQIPPEFFPLIDDFGVRAWKEGGPEVTLRAIND